MIIRLGGDTVYCVGEVVRCGMSALARLEVRGLEVQATAGACSLTRMWDAVAVSAVRLFDSAALTQGG